MLFVVCEECGFEGEVEPIYDTRRQECEWSCPDCGADYSEDTQDWYFLAET